MESKLAKTAILVSHTHWDRAWYLPFTTFRFRLVRLVDRLLDLLETSSDFHSFTLDGQTVLLDDYLDIRPENKPRLERLIESGKLICGPWYVSPDLFLVSPESIIRNLQIGFDTASRFGGSMQVGYVPDPFGHIAQLPQILNGFGLSSFIFMRGLSVKDKAKAGSVFTWRGPDGSDVLSIYLADGYFNAGSLGLPGVYGRHEGLVADPQLAADQIRKTVSKMADLQKEDVFLLNNGFDHMPEQPELPSLLRRTQTLIPDIHLTHGTFGDFVEALRSEAKPHAVVEGDLIGNADQPILLSVYSTRVYLKQQNHQAQSLLETVVEPMDVFASRIPNRANSSYFLERAWKTLLKNHPHDDICGCSHDGVHQDNEVRYREVVETGEAILVEALESMRRAGLQPPSSTGPRKSDVFVFNPHPWSVTTRIATRILFEGDHLPLERIAAIDAQGNALPLHVVGSVEHILRNHYLEQTWGRAYDIEFDITLPPLGYQIVHVFATDAPSAELPVMPAPEPLANLRDSLFFAYEHDLGDTYSFGPDPSGALFKSILVTKKSTYLHQHSITVPVKPESDEQVGIPIEVAHSYSHGSLHTRIRYRNIAENGRMRLIIPLPTSPQEFIADAHFRIAKRGIAEKQTPESHPERYASYPGELTYPTQHFKDFVLVPYGENLVRISAHGLHEAELTEVEGEPVLAITLHRAVGDLSVGGGLIRRVQAGPQIPTPGAQCQRELEFLLHFGIESQADGNAIRNAREQSHRAWVREMPYLPHVKAGELISRSHSMMDIAHPDIEVSAFKRDAATSDLIIRLFNQSSEMVSTTFTIDSRSGDVCTTDLLEQWSDSSAESFQDHQIPVTFGPNQIVTLRIRA